MKKIVILLFVLMTLCSSGCSKEKNDAEQMDEFLEEYSKFAALSKEDNVNPEEECCFGRVIVFDEPNMKGFSPLGTIKDPNGITYVQFASVKEAQDFLKAQQEAGISAEADAPAMFIPEDSENVEDPKNDPGIIRYETEDFGYVLANDYHATSDMNSWGTKYTGASVYVSLIKKKKDKQMTIAVIDAGFDLKHPVLRRSLVMGYDFVDNDGNPTSENFHGTHVAGTIVDMTTGLDIKILPLRVIGHVHINERGEKEEYGTISETTLGIDYAISHGASVINMSMGFSTHSTAIDQAVKRAIAKGVTVVAAAGNDRAKITTSNSCPSHMTENGIIVVSAIDEREMFAEFSNYGSSVDLCAPGVGIVSAYPHERFAFSDGTSMATPHVSAACAMVKMMHPEFSPGDIENFLKEYAKDLGQPGKDDLYGVGTLKLFDCDRDTIEELWVEKMPDKMDYYIGDTLDQKGLVVRAKYLDGTIEELTLNSNNKYTFSPTTFNKAGKTTITIRYKEKECQFTIDIGETPPMVLPEFDNLEPDPTRPGNVIFSQDPIAPEAYAYYVDMTNMKEYGVSYDRSTNTLTLDHIQDGWLNVQAAGNSFKIKVLGDCKLTELIQDGWGHSGTITFTGDGTLTIEGDAIKHDVDMMSQLSQGCIIVEKGVSLKVKVPITIEMSSIENALFVEDRTRVHAKVTSERQDPTTGQTRNQWIIDYLLQERGDVVPVYKTVIEPDEYDYILIDK